MYHLRKGGKGITSVTICNRNCFFLGARVVKVYNMYRGVPSFIVFSLVYFKVKFVPKSLSKNYNITQLCFCKWTNVVVFSTCLERVNLTKSFGGKNVTVTPSYEKLYLLFPVLYLGLSKTKW